MYAPPSSWFRSGAGRRAASVRSPLVPAHLKPERGLFRTEARVGRAFNVFEAGSVRFGDRRRKWDTGRPDSERTKYKRRRSCSGLGGSPSGSPATSSGGSSDARRGATRAGPPRGAPGHGRGGAAREVGSSPPPPRPARDSALFFFCRPSSPTSVRRVGTDLLPAWHCPERCGSQVKRESPLRALRPVWTTCIVVVGPNV